MIEPIRRFGCETNRGLLAHLCTTAANTAAQEDNCRDSSDHYKDNRLADVRLVAKARLFTSHDKRQLGAVEICEVTSEAQGYRRGLPQLALFIGKQVPAVLVAEPLVNALGWSGLRAVEQVIEIVGQVHFDALRVKSVVVARRSQHVVGIGVGDHVRRHGVAERVVVLRVHSVDSLDTLLLVRVDRNRLGID